MRADHDLDVPLGVGGAQRSVVRAVDQRFEHAAVPQARGQLELAVRRSLPVQGERAQDRSYGSAAPGDEPPGLDGGPVFPGDQVGAARGVAPAPVAAPELGLLPGAGRGDGRRGHGRGYEAGAR